MIRSTIISIFLVALALAACSGSASPLSTPTAEGVGTKITVAAGSYTNVSATELQKMLVNKDFILVDVWTAYAGYIPGTDLFISYTVIEQNLDKLPDKTAKIVLYCLAGGVSKDVAGTLVGLGYTNIYRLIEGLTGWEKAGLEIIH
jgi:rhodanese-related sulfurtransferase